jgi:hypothetical protein
VAEGVREQGYRLDERNQDIKNEIGREQTQNHRRYATNPKLPPPQFQTTKLRRTYARLKVATEGDLDER